MIICKTPFRISFFGGGTDYPAWIRDHGGAVLGTTIDKYTYITCRYLPSFFDHKYRIVYSQMENVKSIDDIVHPSVRECIRFSGVQTGLEIHHDSDLPARSGLGSSSAFTVGLLNCLNSLKGESISINTLAKDAIHVEQDLIGENVGCQDQVHAAYGGFNLIEFIKNGNFKVNPMIIKNETIHAIQDHCLLFFTGISRFASMIAKDQIENIPKKTNELFEMMSMVNTAKNILESKKVDIDDFGLLLHENWKIKRFLSNSITNDKIDEIYSLGRKAGALGGKLLGAGSGGFILFFAKPTSHIRIKKTLKSLLHVPFKFEKNGTNVIFKG